MEVSIGIAYPSVLVRTLARPQLGAVSAPSRDPLAEANGMVLRPVDPSGPGGCFFLILLHFCALALESARAALFLDRFVWVMAA